MGEAMTMGCLSIETPAGLVEVGDTVTVDLSRNPIARNYGWPKKATGIVVSAHCDLLEVAFTELKAPRIQSDSPLPPPLGFMLWLGADNAETIVKVVKP